MRPMIGIRRQGLYKLDVAAKLVRHDDARLAKLPDQSGEETLGRPGVAAPLNQDVEHIAISIDRPPEPELLSAIAMTASSICHMWTAPSLQELFDNLIGSLAFICPACWCAHT